MKLYIAPTDIDTNTGKVYRYESSKEIRTRRWMNKASLLHNTEHRLIAEEHFNLEARKFIYRIATPK